MSAGANFEVEAAARGDVAGLKASALPTEKTQLEARDDIPVDSDADSDVLVGPNGEQYPTQEEIKTMRRTHGHIPWVIYTIGLVELCERFAYYGTIIVFTNFIAYKLPAEGPHPKAGAAGTDGQSGALDMGQQASTGLTLFNQFWAYLMPLAGGYVADTYLGRFNTISVAIVIAIVGHILIVVAAVPSVIAGGNSLAPFIIGLILFGIGVGFFKANISPLIAEQYEHDNPRPVIITLKSGERAISDPQLTISRIYVRYYFMINVGALGGQIAMVWAEKYVGFWLSFTLPTILFLFCPIIMFICRNRYVGRKPTGSVLGNALHLIAYAAKHRVPGESFFAGALPSKVVDKPSWMIFDDAWVWEVRRGLKACAVFSFLPIYWLSYSQVSNNLVNQAATMKLGGVPNDIVQNLDPITLLIFIPIFDKIVYPALARKGFNFTPLKKIALGFLLGLLSMIAAAVLQYYIYQKSPCGYHASDQDCIAELGPPDISVWAQTPAYLLIAWAEIFANITALEYAFTKAPKNMRSMVTGIYWFSNAFSSALGQAFVPLAVDPHITWLYGSIAILTFVAGIAFVIVFRKTDAEEEAMNALPESTYQGRKGYAVDLEAVQVEQEKQDRIRRAQGLV